MKNIIQQIWPQWTLVEQLGKGSYGTVYKAVRKDSRVNATAAIKVIAVPQDASEQKALLADGMTLEETRTYFKGIVDDFVEEIALMETFKGMQNIVSIEDYQVVENPETDGWLILVRMELLTPFDDYVLKHEMTEDEVIQVGLDLCTALAFCSQRNIIHRDIKLENIFVNDFGSFKLGDFGVAKRFENMAASHSQKGTFNYMAPEVANGTHYDTRVDIYSLGIVLYKLLNQNNPPFINAENRLSPAERKLALERRLSGEPLPAPSEASDAMAKVILKACAYKPEDRFADAADFKMALAAVRSGILNDIWPSEPTKGVSVETDDYDKTVSLKKARRADPDATMALNGRKSTKNPETQVTQTNTEKLRKKKPPKALFFGTAALLIVCLIAIVWGISRFRNQKEEDSTSKEIDSVTTASTTVVDTSPSEQEIEEEVQLEKAVEGDIVNFGRNHKWLVLAKEEDRVLLITEKIIFTMPWAESNRIQDWENSSIRRWLETTFYEKFDSEEASRIIPVYFSSDYTVQFELPENENCKGRFFLLSKEEVYQYFMSVKDRQCLNHKGVRNGWWWLRTPAENNKIWNISTSGSLSSHLKTDSLGGVRPAIWVSLTEHYDDVEIVLPEQPTTREVPTTTEAPTRPWL